MGDPFRSGQLISIHGFIEMGREISSAGINFVLMCRRQKEHYVQVNTNVLIFFSFPNVQHHIVRMKCSVSATIRQCGLILKYDGCFIPVLP